MMDELPEYTLAICCRLPKRRGEPYDEVGFGEYWAPDLVEAPGTCFILVDPLRRAMVAQFGPLRPTFFAGKPDLLDWQIAENWARLAPAALDAVEKQGLSIHGPGQYICPASLSSLAIFIGGLD
jgi:hypothetical protein